MRVALAALCVALWAATSAFAVSPYYEDFETGTDGWQIWPGSNSQLDLDTSHNHTPGYQSTPGNPLALPPGHAYRGSEGVPGGFASYHTIADGTGKLRVETWVYVDNANPDVDDSLGGISLTQGPNNGTDYIQFVWTPSYAGGTEQFSVRTRRRDQLALGTYDTNYNRPAINDWFKMTIEADAGVGGDLRFYINDDLLYTGIGERLGNDLNTIRLGLNFGNQRDTVWYDDVRVMVPEPASISLLALAGLAIVGCARRRR